MDKMCIGCLARYDEYLPACPVCGYVEGVNAQDYCHLPPRTVLGGRYTLGRPLGNGGFGVTYIAWDSVLEARVAIKEYMPGEMAVRSAGTVKVMPKSRSAGDLFRKGKQSFIEESRRLAQLGDVPGVVKIYDCIEENNTAYIVMEYLDGRTLSSVLAERGRLPFDTAIPIMLKVLEALERVHAAGMMHRDISPDNIMLCSDGRVVLIDFGAARHITTRHSRSLSAIVKIGYAPAEQYHTDGNQGSWTDVYAVGATLYHALTGVIPIDAYSRRASDDMKKPSAYARMPAAVETAILNAMNVLVENRTQTAQEFADQLSGAVKPKRIRESITREKLTVSGRMKTAFIIAAAAVALAAVLIIAGVPALILPDAEAVVPEGMSRVPAVQNKSVVEAGQLLSDSSLMLRISERIHDDYLERDVVLLQSPRAGSVAYVGSMVDVTVSAPEETEAVPDVRNINAQEAVRMLESFGLVADLSEAYSDTVAPGAVISQSVEGGEGARPGDVIAIVISLGPENSDIDTSVSLENPAVVGMDFDAAQAMLLAKSLYLAKSGSVYDETVPAGQIITQTPPGGATVYQGDTINVVVSLGAETASVPNVQYMTEAAAKERLAAKKLTASVSYEESQTVAVGLVIRQDVPSGTTLRPGATVQLVVSAGYKVTVPACVGKSTGQAQTALSAVRLASSVVTQPSATIPAGQVISQSIEAGATVEQGTTVTLTVSAGNSAVAVTGVALSPTSASLSVGQTVTLISAPRPSNATDTRCGWSSSSPAVASVDANGVVTAKSVGTARITVTTTDGGHTAFCQITVSRVLVSLTLESQPSKTTYYLGDQLSTSSMSAVAAYNDGSTARVTESCTLSGFSSAATGTKTVVVSYTEGGVTRTASFYVNVLSPGVSLSSASLLMQTDNTAALAATVVPSGQAVTWSSSSSAVASVANGTVTANGAGSATITASITYAGKIYSASCAVTVSSRVTPSITLSRTTLSLMPGDSATLAATVVPAGQAAAWSSSNSAVASVVNGAVTANGAGSATITASFSYAGQTYTASCAVTVNAPYVTNPTIALSAANLQSSSYLTAAVTPAGQPVTWSSSDPSVMSVSQSGVVTAYSTGVAIITASMSCNGRTYTAEQEVTAYLLGDVDFNMDTSEEGRKRDIELIYSHMFEMSKELKDQVISRTACGYEYIADVDKDGTIGILDTVMIINDFNSGTVRFTLRATTYSTDIQYAVANNQAQVTGYTGSEAVIVIPSKLGLHNVTRIGSSQYMIHAFESSGVKAFVMPNSVTHIEQYAFARCFDLRHVRFSSGLVEIGEFAFAWCNGLTRVTLPDSIKVISRGAFCECLALSNVNIPYGVREIGWITFLSCPLVEITIPNSVTRIEEAAFHNTDISTLLVPNSVTYIGEDSFGNCHNLSQLTLSEGLVVIDDEAFARCNLLVEVEIPNSVTTIGEMAFCECTNLRRVRIPLGVEHFGAECFTTYPSGGDNRMVFYCDPSSSAYSYAAAHNIATAPYGDYPD